MLPIAHPTAGFLLVESGAGATERRRTLEDFAARARVAAMAVPRRVQAVARWPHSRPHRDIRCCMAHTPSDKPMGPRICGFAPRASSDKGRPLESEESPKMRRLFGIAFAAAALTAVTSQAQAQNRVAV